MMKEKTIKSWRDFLKEAMDRLVALECSMRELQDEVQDVHYELVQLNQIDKQGLVAHLCTHVEATQTKLDDVIKSLALLDSNERQCESFMTLQLANDEWESDLL